MTQANSNKNDFFHTLFKEDIYNEREHVWFAGDFNVPPHIYLTQIPGEYNPNARNYINVQKSTYDLSDI